MRFGGWFPVAVLLSLGCSAPEPPPAPHAGENVPPPVAPAAGPTSDPLMPLLDLPSAEAAMARATSSFPFLEGEPEGASVSIGDTTHGRLANGRELTESASLKILPRQKERDLRYGTEQLVALLSHAGTALFEKTQTPLWVGNLGRRDGGDIEWSVSHNAGRDADVAFCYRDVATGKPATPKDLVQIFQDGLSKDKTLAFDTARTWVVVKALVEFQGASLQYLFISDALKKKLLEHARAIKEPAAIIERAAELLRQPGAAAAHDDHLHVRVYCSQMDAAGGCRDQGVVHPFAKTFEAEREKAAGKARKQLADARPTRRRRALLRLGLVGDARDVPAGLSYLADPAPEVRVAASELVAALGKDEHTPKLIDRFQVEDDSAVLAALVESIGFLGGKDAGVFFRDVLLATASAEVLGFSAKAIPLDAATAPYFLGLASDPYPPMRSLLAPTPVVDLTFDRSALQRLSVRAVRHAGSIEPIEALVDALDERETSIGLEAARSLAFLTNHDLLETAEARSLSVRLVEAKGRYQKLLAQNGKLAREGWLISGFSKRGYKIKALDKAASWELLRAAADEPHISYNARAVLTKLFDQPREIAHYGMGDGCRLLYRFLSDKRSELSLARPN
ncbi:MAG: penicillin-insensitive murein endopeptidase, partial [Polyangiaceae bacterium]|nr:penicillin-insensitive murein endopeptidase [Polyangiaceae bacterium]